MRRIGLLSLAAVLVVVTSACGSSSSPEAAEEPACIILISGNKLCGDDARAYCDRFISGSADEESKEACRAVEEASSEESSSGDAQSEPTSSGHTTDSGAADRKAAAAAARAHTEEFRLAVDNAVGSRAAVAEVDKFGRVVVNFARGHRPSDPLIKRICAAIATVDRSARALINGPEDEYGLQDVVGTCGKTESPG